MKNRLPAGATADPQASHRNLALLRTDGQARDAPQVTVALADGHPVVRSGLRALLTSVGGIEVVAEVGTASEAVRAASLHRPDVVVLDVDLGTGAIEDILRAVPGIGVLVFTMVEDDTSIVAAVRAGARGYIFKNAETDRILRAIRGVAAGEAILGPHIAGRLPRLMAGLPVDRGGLADLTAREREVLELVAAGLPNSAIARRLGLASKTISNHLSAIFGKLGVASRAEAVGRLGR